MRSRRFNLAFLLCIAAGVSTGAWAQIPKSAVAKSKPGNLDGEVVNAKGAPVTGAQVLWQAADGETPHVLHSDAHGRFHLQALRAAFYDLRASASGASTNTASASRAAAATK